MNQTSRRGSRRVVAAVALAVAALAVAARIGSVSSLADGEWSNR
jgi:hypothetical protein